MCALPYKPTELDKIKNLHDPVHLGVVSVKCLQAQLPMYT